jgi:hypothetical protein
MAADVGGLFCVSDASVDVDVIETPRADFEAANEISTSGNYSKVVPVIASKTAPSNPARLPPRRSTCTWTGRIRWAGRICEDAATTGGIAREEQWCVSLAVGASRATGAELLHALPDEQKSHLIKFDR